MHDGGIDRYPLRTGDLDVADSDTVALSSMMPVYEGRTAFFLLCFDPPRAPRTVIQYSYCKHGADAGRLGGTG